MKNYIFIFAGSAFLFILTGGSNLLASYILSLENFAVYTQIHMSAVYWSAIFSIAIQFTAPRIVTINMRDYDADKALYSLSLCSSVTFGFLSLLILMIFIDKNNINSTDGYVTIILAIFFSFAQNIYGILLASKKYALSAIFILSMVSLYLLSVIFVSRTGEIILEYWLNSVIICYTAAVLFTFVHSEIDFVSPINLIKFVKSIAVSRLLLPSICGGFLNGFALVLIYSSFTRNANNEQIALLGYAILLKSAVQFLSHVVNKIIYIDLSYSHEISKFKMSYKFFIKKAIYNIASLLVGVIIIFSLYRYFYEIYFYKFDKFTVISYGLVLMWLSMELVYFVLYQFVQVNAYMWSSVFYISFPSFIYGIIIYAISLVTLTSSVLMIYIGLTFVSIFGMTFIIYLYANDKKDQAIV